MQPEWETEMHRSTFLFIVYGHTTNNMPGQTRPGCLATLEMMKSAVFFTSLQIPTEHYQRLVLNEKPLETFC